LLCTNNPNKLKNAGGYKLKTKSPQDAIRTINLLENDHQVLNKHTAQVLLSGKQIGDKPCKF